ncbi:MAG: preprotein translocase subunit SecE [Candidatus Gastranaerophilales bacterium]|nr:preprotein translocase subunit SecE [Candidatus Gastranaerophilales bacterium]
MNDNFSNTKNAISNYFKGVRAEWGKITWPEKHQVVVETFFVVAIVFIFTVFIYFVDIIFNALLSGFNFHA